MKNKIIGICNGVKAWCLYLLIICIPLNKGAIELLISVAIFAFFVKKILEYKTWIWKFFPPTELNVPLGFFLVLNALSIVTSLNSGLSIMGFLGKTLEYFFLFFVVIDTAISQRHVRNVLMAIFFSLVIMIVDSAAQYTYGKDFVRHFSLQGSFLRASFSSHNGFGGWLIVMIPIVLTLAIWDNRKSWIKRIPLIMLTAVLLLCLLLTRSRGAYLGLFFGLGFIFIYMVGHFAAMRHKLVMSLIVVICLSTVIFLVPKAIKKRAESNLDIKTFSAFNRINSWQESLAIINDYPFFGSGLNTYSAISPHYKIFEGGGGYAHNSYLQMASEIGIVGLILFFWILLEFFKSTVPSLGRTRDDFLLLGILGGIISFLVHSFFDTNLYALQQIILFWFMIGFAVSLTRLKTSGSINIR